MKRYINIPLCLLVVFLTISGCKKDPYSGVTSNEKSIEEFTLGNGLVQVGPAVVDRDNAKVQVRVLTQPNTDLSKVSATIRSSYKSSVYPESGQAVDFKANNNTYKYTVTSESGQTRDWTVELIPFTETIIGNYDIQNLFVYGGTGPEYGGGSVFKLSDKSGWPVGESPSAELDNHLSFTFSGVTPEGNTFGDFVNDAGADGKYANFIYSGKTPSSDVNGFYRVMPKGQGKWTRNYSANTVTFTFSDGKTATGMFISPGTEDFGNGNKKITTDNAFAFTLNGSDDYGNIYSDFDKIVKRPRKYWIDVKKL